jgi:hypothetical protein
MILNMREEIKRIIRWSGANYSLRANCNKCGKKKQVGHVHQLSGEHGKLCIDCWKKMPKGWRPCVCGRTKRITDVRQEGD